MMTEKETIRTSKFLSLVLRHQPEKIGIQLDETGWTEVSTLLNALRSHGVVLSLENLRHVVETNNKKRFAFDDSGLKIRASQGHSIDIDLDYVPKMPPEILYHGTAHTFLASILNTGLDKRKRHHVHLSKDVETALQVGGRHGKPVVLTILAGKMAAQGFAFFQSENGVWLTEHVPTEFIEVPR